MCAPHVYVCVYVYVYVCVCVHVPERASYLYLLVCYQFGIKCVTVAHGCTGVCLRTNCDSSSAHVVLLHRPCATDQLKWLKQDLANANQNRHNVPWVWIACWTTSIFD